MGIALQLESPFGDKDNDLPMIQMQRDWNKSLTVLMQKRGHRPPYFVFDPDIHRQLHTTTSDGTMSCPKPSKVLPRRTSRSTVQGKNGSADSFLPLHQSSL